MLTLTQRSCVLGLKSSTDGKEIDGQEVKLLTLELEDVKLDKRELNALLGEPHAWNVLYNTGVKPPEPYLKALKTLELREPIEGAAVTLSFGVSSSPRLSSVAFAKVRLSKLKLELQSGGETVLSLKLTAAPALDATFGELLEHLGRLVEVEMRFEPSGQQQDLPLNKFFGEGNLRDGTHFAFERTESPPQSPDDGDDDDAETATLKRKRKPKTIKRPPPKRKSTNGHAPRAT